MSVKINAYDDYVFVEVVLPQLQYIIGKFSTTHNYGNSVVAKWLQYEQLMWRLV